MERLIIDTDPGVDDAIAILLAIYSKKINIEAITTVCGNCSLEQATKNALKTLNIGNANHIPVYAGANKPLRNELVVAKVHGDDGLGNTSIPESNKEIEKEYAPDYLVRIAKQYPKEITLAPIGPLTNIAIAVENDPNFAKNIKRLVIMGGAEFGGNSSPVAEFNFWEDPEAAKIVFNAGFDEIVMVGLDATNKVVFSPKLREYLKHINTPIAKFIYDITDHYMYAEQIETKIIGCVIFDALVTGYIIDESILELKDCYVDIATEGICKGQSVVDNDGQYHNGKCNARVAYNAYDKKFFDIFYNTLFKEYHKDIKLILDTEFSN